MSTRRSTRLLNAKTRADATKGLRALDAEAQKNPAGQLDEAGEVYYGAGDYQNAATPFPLESARQIKQQDGFQVFLGRAQQLKNTAEARRLKS